MCYGIIQLVVDSSLPTDLKKRGKNKVQRREKNIGGEIVRITLSSVDHDLASLEGYTYTHVRASFIEHVMSEII